METLFKKHKMFISQTNMNIVRDMINRVNWSKQLVAIKGSRGVGKTTLSVSISKLNEVIKGNVLVSFNLVFNDSLFSDNNGDNKMVVYDPDHNSKYINTTINKDIGILLITNNELPPYRHYLKNWNS